MPELLQELLPVDIMDPKCFPEKRSLPLQKVRGKKTLIILHNSNKSYLTTTVHAQEPLCQECELLMVKVPQMQLPLTKQNTQ